MLKEIVESIRFEELKLGSGMKSVTYLKLIKKAIGSKKFKTRKEGDFAIADYDDFSLVFNKEGYLVGVIIDGKTYQISKKVKSIKDIKILYDAGKLGDKEID